MYSNYDTQRLSFLIDNGGRLDNNANTGYIYWYADPSKGRTLIVENRTAREAIDAAINGESNVKEGS